MKTRLFKTILALTLALIALPMMGQDYLTIYFKDGKTERHLLSLIKEITTSKVDLNGVTHSDCQVQQIWMDDTIYTHSLEDIDSLSFRKVNEEQVVQNAESVSSTLEVILRDCDSFDEIKSYSEQIRNNPGVEEVVVNDNSVIVRIKDWRDLVILSSYKDGVDMSEYNIKRQLPSRISKMRKSYPINQSLHVAIADQNAKNESEAYALSTSTLKDIQTTFEEMGYDVDYIPQPDLTFFRQNIFNYDLILLTTHGSFDGSLHWFATGEEIGDHGYFWGLSRETTQAWFNSRNDLDDAKFCFIKEKRSGENRWILYTLCSEDYIRKSPFTFGNKNPIIFTNVCESLNGNNSVAEMFLKKGASIYLGYEGSTYLGEYATGEFFCDWMLNGTSAQFAYENLQDFYKKESETKYEGAVLKIVPEENNSSFIVNTITAPSSEVKDEILDDGVHVYTVYGYTTMNFDLGIIKGFQFSFNPNMENSENAVCTSETYLPNNGKGNYRFQVSLKSHKTFYYRAYTYDGLNYNYGESCEFTIEKMKDLELSHSTFSINDGESTTIDITSGNGEYDIKNSNDKAVGVTLDGDKLIIEAIGAGESTITITDNKTGQTATITVTVNAADQERVLMLNTEVNGTTYRIYRQANDENDTHRNSDGWMTCKSSLTLDITKNGSTKTYTIDNNIYLDKSLTYNEGQAPCLMLNFQANEIGVFLNSKDAMVSYTMDGYYYTSPMNNINFQRETVFDASNWGWFPYFTYDSSAGQPKLHHFSYAGYYAMTSTRNSNGSWSTSRGGHIMPDNFKQQSQEIGNVIVVGSAQ